MSNKDLKKRILDAIAHVRANGFTLVSLGWGDPEHECACAISAVIHTTDPTVPMDDPATAAKMLGVSEEWIKSFIEGYDGYGTADQSAVPEACKMGIEVRKETKPIDYHLWDGEKDG